MKHPMRLAWLLVGTVVATVIAATPRASGTRPPATIEGLVAELTTTGLAGGPLADAATLAVCREFPVHTVWSLWEPPSLALANGRGWSHQYNTVLLKVLRGLGFRARLVHAARVRGWPHPWFFASHAWVKVEVDDRWRDACASRSGNRLGQVGFTPVTDVLPFRCSTRWTVPVGLAPFVVGGVLRAWLTGREIPDWIRHQHH